MIRQAWVIGSLLVPHVALAAPFCITILGVSPVCIYTDAGECQREATKQGGTCEPDPQTPRVSLGTGKYCLLINGAVSLCNYTNYTACAQDANQQHGACYFDPAGSAGVPNPFAVSNGG